MAPSMTSTKLAHTNGFEEDPANLAKETHSLQPLQKYCHYAATHSKTRPSRLGHDSRDTPSFVGFRNLMILGLVVMNLRLVVENFMKYGVLICIRCHDYRRQDVFLAVLLYTLVPCHLFVAHVIEVAAATHAHKLVGQKKKREDRPSNFQIELRARIQDPTWALVAFAHTVNATLCLAITSFVVYYNIHHPLIGTICEVHAIIVWLKICSYAFTNRDLRQAMLHPHLLPALPETFKACQYPHNITIANLSYFWWAPTLVYQPVYPRTPRIRWGFVVRRLVEVAGLSIFIWVASAQYAAPTLQNSLDKLTSLDFVSILERLMKLSVVSSIIWLAGFFAIFQSMLNALAELMRFGDREFYSDWWNSPSLGAYWRSWNKPVYNFMKRHIYGPLVGRGWSHPVASAMVFVFSGILHEAAVGIPTHNIIGIAFGGMIAQIPLIAFTTYFERAEGVNERAVGNCIFWIFFCGLGQPAAALSYFFAWQAKYGSISQQPMKPVPS